MVPDMENRWCVLLVEDDIVLGPLTLEAMILMGHDGELANSSDDAYAHLSGIHRFDIVLLDLQLGEGRGEDIVHRLRREGFQVPRILILSALPTSDLKRSCMSIQAHGHLQKPSTMQQIHESMVLAMA
jgi:DNA-binding response OmpR family regulator